MNEPLRNLGVQLPERWVEAFDQVANQNNVTRSAVIRALLDVGIEAQAESDFEADYEQFHRLNIAEQKSRGLAD